MTISQPNNRLRVIIYVRVSSEEQAREGHSLEAQLKICRAFAEQRGWIVIAVYEDPGRSGKDDRRPGFQQALADVRGGKADVMLTHKLDRFSRNIGDVLRYMREFSKLGVGYVSATEQFDFTTPMGKVMLVMLAAFAEWYLDNLSAETKKGKRARAEKGFWNGDPPFGYRINTETSRLELEPREADAVRMAFREHATGNYTDIEIAQMLNKAGFRTRGKGKRQARPFSKDTVREMLKNVFYLGLVKYKSETFAGQHEAIIDRHTFDRSISVRRAAYAYRTNHANHATRVYPLSGIVRCNECQRRLRGQHLPKRGRIYHDPAREQSDRCSQPPNVLAEVVEEDVAEVLSKIIVPTKWKERMLARMKARRGRRNDERDQNRLKAQLARAKQLFITGDLTEREYNTEKARIQIELDATSPVPEVDLEQAGELLSSFPNVWRKANEEQRKRLLQSILEGVLVEEGRVVAIVPKPAFYPLLTGGGPDERPARVQLTGSPAPRTVLVLRRLPALQLRPSL